MTFRLFRSSQFVLLPLFAFVTVACGRHPLIDKGLAEELRARVAQNGSPGTVLAVFDKDRVEYLCLGRMGLQDGRKPDEHSRFEVASITKTFTSLLLADMVTRGEVALDDPAEKWIKPPMRTPRFQGRTFSLLDLSTHRSGLERDLPHELDPAGLVKLLGQLSLLSAPGARFNYSNFGVAVLARALADRAGKDYIPLVTERVLQPLGLRDSTFDLLDSDRGRLVSGAVPPLGLNMLSPAGGLKASASDLVRYLREQMGEIEVR